jgi:hypothetical protein
MAISRDFKPMKLHGHMKSRMHVIAIFGDTISSRPTRAEAGARALVRRKPCQADVVQWSSRRCGVQDIE